MSGSTDSATATAPITVLASGAALGVYVPALLCERRLERAGVAAETVVLESLYTSASHDRLERHRRAFRTNFALAQMAHRMPTPDLGLDPIAVDELLQRWCGEQRTRFIVWSGFWRDLLTEYAERGRCGLEIDLCRIDAVPSTSHRDWPGRLPVRDVWFWSAASGGLVYGLPVDGRPPRPFAERPRRLTVHGGGWGIGTYLERATALADSGLGLDVVVQRAGESGLRPPHAEYRVDPDWRPWQRDATGRHSFPPLGRGDASTFAAPATHHALFDRIADSVAIVSKPGGGTLLDSLAAATPVVLLEPYGPAEEENAALWQQLGFGISYARWQQTGFDLAVLAELHEALLRRTETIDYPAAYAQRVRAASASDRGAA